MSQTSEPIVLLNDQGRIIPERVPEALRALGIQPARRCWVALAASGWEDDYRKRYDGNTCIACLVGLAAANRIGIEAADELAGREDQAQNLSAEAGLPWAYAIGLSDGWEDTQSFHHYDESTRDYFEAYDAGVADGKAAYRACRVAGMKIVDP